MQNTYLCINYDIRMRSSGFITFIIILATLCHTADARKKDCKIIAHRGFWNCEEAGFAHNSVAALKCAQEAGIWGSEFDICMTSDEILVVHHESKIDGKSIEKTPYADIQDFKLENGEPLPTIDDYLEQGKKYPGTILVYEIKPHSSTETEDRVIELSVAKLKEYELFSPDRVMFISFSIHICETLAREYPEFSVQFLGSSRNPDELAEKGINGVDYNHMVYSIHKKWYRMARKNNMSVNSWTVNNTVDMKRMLKLGVDYITTDNPLTALELTQGGKSARDD